MILNPGSAFMMASLKSREIALVGERHFERVAFASNGADARDALRDTDIGAWLAGTDPSGARGLDEVLWRYFGEVVGSHETHRFFPSAARKFCSVYLLKYDVLNLRIALQGLGGARKPLLLPIGVLHKHGRLGDLGEAKSVEELGQILKACGLQAFEPLVRDHNPTGALATRLIVDTSLENEYNRILERTAQSLPGGGVLAGACGLAIDLTNLSILCRALLTGVGTAAGGAFIPGGRMLDLESLREALAGHLQDMPQRVADPFCRRIAGEVVAACENTGTLAVPDEVIEKHRLAALRALLAPQVAPVAIMAWYLILKEIELRNVRLLLRAVEDGLTLAEIRRSLLP